MKLHNVFTGGVLLLALVGSMPSTATDSPAYEAYEKKNRPEDNDSSP